jgi:hypothetical protein
MILLGGMIALLAFGASVLILSAVGHVLTRQALLVELLADCKNEIQFQSRCSRRQAGENFERIRAGVPLPLTEAEKIIAAMEAEERGEPTNLFDGFAKLGKR